MTTIKLEGRLYPLEPKETVLDGLLRGGVNAPYSCRVGACQTCILRATSGAVPPAAQVGLKETMKARGYFLACICRPTEDLTLHSVGDELRIEAELAAIDRLTPSVVRVRLRLAAPWEYRAGQYASLHREDGLARSYSLASLPSDGVVELHVRKLREGRMSGWLYNEAEVGEKVHIQGPSGDCFYVAGRPEQPILLAGSGTGLAPLYGVLRDALANGHTGPIWLFHGAREEGGLYLMDELRAIAEANPQVRYRPSVFMGEPSGDVRVGSLEKLIIEELPKLVGFRAFLCGHPDIVSGVKKRVFLAGIPMREIHADPFLPSAA
jgi:CDP-4-dehydro-6-deoxyglucose reductase, E3